MHLRAIHRSITRTIAAVGLAACHESTVPPRSASLQFSGAANATDTALAVLAQPLVVEVRDSTGALAPAGTLVELRSVRPAEAYPISDRTATFYENPLYPVRTNEAGRAEVYVKLWTRAGTARVVASVPSLGVEDTARFTVTPGNASRMGVVPFDTTLYVGGSFPLRGGIVDRYGNPRPDPVTWSSADPLLPVSSTGVVTATALGRYYVRAVGALGTDSGAVSVVPPARLAGWVGDPAGTSSFTIFTINADGSHETPLVTGMHAQLGFAADPVWIPGRDALVYMTVVGVGYTLYVVGSDGVTKQFLVGAPATMTHQVEPVPSRDGRWLYFSAFDSRCPTSRADPCVARARIDGSAPELVVFTPSRYPAPSPDGSKVAYMEIASSTIKVFDLATGTTLPWSVPGSMPAWSPDGAQIAYRQYDGRVALIAPDGTGQRTLSPESTSDVLGWSADGQWLLVEQPPRTALMNVATGRVLPLGYTHQNKFVTSIR